VRACPKNLRRFAAREWTSEALAAKLKKNTDLAGVTFSGGEPLAQHEFLFEVIAQIKPMHIAIETSGYAPNEVFCRMLGLTDLVLMDIKIPDEESHIRYTGVSNIPILNNLKSLKQSGVAYEIRIPVIPGINDTMENMRAIAALLESSDTLVRVELLAYNLAAGAKYQLAHREFAYKPTNDTVNLRTLADAFKEKHIEVFIP